MVCIHVDKPGVLRAAHAVACNAVRSCCTWTVYCLVYRLQTTHLHEAVQVHVQVLEGEVNAVQALWQQEAHSGAPVRAGQRASMGAGGKVSKRRRP